MVPPAVASTGRLALPGEAQWLAAWDRANALPPGWREAALLEPACPDATPAMLAALPLGERDALLLQVRRALFGPTMACSACCPACGERCEWEQPAVAPPAPALQGDEGPVWQQAGWRVRLRVPSGLDAAALAEAGASTDAAAWLACCVVEAQRDGIAVRPGEVPATLAAPLADALVAADPRLDTAIALICPACAHAWEADLDIGAYLLAELDGWARGLLGEVHELARAYGWTEAEVLALGPRRRAAYLAMVGTG
jgi:hypothetical protein